MLSADFIRELRTSWLPNVNDIGIDSIDFMAFRITAMIGNGDKIDSCFILSRTLPIAARGPRNCNSEVEGWVAFQPLE